MYIVGSYNLFPKEANPMLLGDNSMSMESELWEIELGKRAAFALFHHDDVMFGEWF